ncbi:MAG TPA: DUF1570 domain-containing protein [Pirellulales bacterium]|nr:DUF1570 domain-containing protein [Pirellulales bacterium]
MLRLRLIAAVCLLACAPLRAAEKNRWTLDLTLDGNRLEGFPLSWSESQVNLLGRDGRLWTFPPTKASDFHKTTNPFRGYSAAEVRSRLSGELGKNFEISGTGHYLVAHPPGQRDYWSQRFEDLYRSFVHYFSVRGFRMQAPEFPLTAIVFRNQGDFLRYSQAEGTRVGGNVLGYYSLVSNRIVLFDQGGGGASASDWQENAATIVHEAAHQTAFNTGIHARFAEQPRWLVEGLGTMFEARGVWDSSRYRSRPDRFNRGRLQQFQQYAPRRPPNSLAEFVSSDRPFNADINAGYAQAWALSFFLVETRPRQYCDYLARVAKRPDFQSYPPPERLADFTAVFGPDLRMLEAHFLKFMAELK